MKYWWVNHKQTARQEISGGYLWSPKVKSNGTRNRFYDNMRAASPGDPVVSFADARIGYVGRVSDFAITFRKPEEFGSAGDNWQHEGWLLPVEWRKVPVPVRPQEHIADLRDLLPEQYSPIRAENGYGNQGAYLAQVSGALFERVASLTGFSFDSTETVSPGKGRDELDDEVTAEIEATHLSETEFNQQVKARRGQGKFRENVLKVERSCRVTGIDDPAFLTASHIKPWRSCVTGEERLDGHNGLMLTPSVDFLFDKGFITFEVDGKVVRSNVLPDAVAERLGLKGSSRSGAKPLSSRQENYMKWHRQNVFLGSVGLPASSEPVVV